MEPRRHHPSLQSHLYQLLASPTGGALLHQSANPGRLHTSPSVPDWLREKALDHYNEGSLIRALSQKQRKEYYALVGRQHQPLFDDNYDDTVCLDDRHRQAMIAYVHDNPRRAILRRLLPDVMQRCLHVKIGNRSYGAFGNLFLLRWANKVQV